MLPQTAVDNKTDNDNINDDNTVGNDNDNNVDQKQLILDNVSTTTKYKSCTLHELFNLVQRRICLGDLRPATEYNQSHIIGAVNIPEPNKLTNFDETYPAIFVFYGNPNTTTKDIIDHLYTIAKNESKSYPNPNNNLFFYVFNGKYNDFYLKYKYLCVSNDNNNIIKQTQYPAMILDNSLYLGDGFMSENKDVINNLKITHIISVTKCFFMLDPDIKKKIKYLQIKIEDSAYESISSYFDQACNFIDNALKNKKNKVFIHCMAGVSRSSTITIAYLMISKKYTLCDAYIHVKRCRPQIHPNNGFENELVAYEKKLFAKSTKADLDKALKSKEFTMKRSHQFVFGGYC